jgi:hypothetical protein
MFLNGLKHNLLKTKVNKTRQKPIQTRQSTCIQTVGVLVDARFFEEWSGLKKMMDNLSQSVESKIVFYTEKKEANTAENQIALRANDFSLVGGLKNPEIEAFVKKPFDLLLSYYSTENVFLDFVSAQSNALFRVGVSEDMMEFNDLTIKTPLNQIDVFERELINYLKILKRIK